MGADYSIPVGNSGFRKQNNYQDSSDSDSSSDHYQKPATPFPYVEVPVSSRKSRQEAVQDYKEHYNGTEPWRAKFQPLYETKKDKARLGRMIGGSLTVTEAEKAQIDTARKRNK